MSLTNTFKHLCVTALSHPIALPSKSLFLRSFSSTASYKQGETKPQVQYSACLVGRTLDWYG